MLLSNVASFVALVGQVGAVYIAGVNIAGCDFGVDTSVRSEATVLLDKR